MRYQVPKFIDVPDKIFGPFTLKQFLYLGGGAAIAFIMWSTLPRLLALIFGLPVTLFFLALAFKTVNGRPMIFHVESMLKYGLAPKLYIWKKERKPIKKQEQVEKDDTSGVFIPRLSDSKLKDIAWGLDINDTLRNYNEQEGLDTTKSGSL